MLTLPAKQIRAQLIKEYMREAGYDRAVCFTCGNAGQALVAAGVPTLVIGGGLGDLRPGRWWSQAEIRACWPHYFDATSGHLPNELITRLARAFGDLFKWEPPDDRCVPTGSGETVLALALAFPGCRWRACYDNRDPATAYMPRAPLNDMVRCLCATVFIDANGVACGVSDVAG